MTQPDIPAHYAAASSATLLGVAIELAEVLGAMREIPDGPELLGDDDSLGPDVRAALSPFAERMSRALADAMLPLVQAEIDVVKGELLRRFVYVDNVRDILARMPAPADSAA